MSWSKQEHFAKICFIALMSCACTAQTSAQRREDIPLLAKALLQRLAEQHGRPPPALSAAALSTLNTYPWPGNVRQLVNTLERAMVLADTIIEAEDLELFSKPQQNSNADGSFDGKRLLRLAEVEARHVAAALQHCNGNRSEAARQLGISRPTLLRKIGEYGIEGYLRRMDFSPCCNAIR